MKYDILVRSGPAGRFTAVVMGLAELRAEADTEIEAIQLAHQLLKDWLATARVVSIELPEPTAINPLVLWAGHAKNDPDFDQYRAEIERFRREADERACTSSSSTPTT